MRVDFLRVGEDWMVVYVDGEARYQGHSLQPDWIRELILLPAHTVNDWEMVGLYDDPPDTIDFTDGELLQRLSISEIS